MSDKRRIPQGRRLGEAVDAVRQCADALHGVIPSSTAGRINPYAQDAVNRLRERLNELATPEEANGR